MGRALAESETSIQIVLDAQNTLQTDLQTEVSDTVNNYLMVNPSIRPDSANGFLCIVDEVGHKLENTFDRNVDNLKFLWRIYRSLCAQCGIKLMDIPTYCKMCGMPISYLERHKFDDSPLGEFIRGLTDDLRSSNDIGMIQENSVTRMFYSKSEFGRTETPAIQAQQRPDTSIEDLERIYGGGNNGSKDSDEAVGGDSEKRP